MADRSHSLLQAASTIFVLMTVLPLLIFTWTLYTLDNLGSDSAQIGLGLSLVLSLTGFAILRSIMAQLSELSRGLVRAAGEPVRAAGEPGAPAWSPSSNPAAATAPGIGQIDEFDEMTATMAALWQREAVAHVGHQVLVTLVRTPNPLAGTLQELTSSGVVLNQSGEEIRITYQHIASIEPTPTPPSPAP